MPKEKPKIKIGEVIRS
jgi:transcriptional regulator with XRE-family HTH domain